MLREMLAQVSHVAIASYESCLDGTGEGERKRTADRELLSSDALAVYIDGAGLGGGGGQRHIYFGTSPSRLT